MFTPAIWPLLIVIGLPVLCATVIVLALVFKGGKSRKHHQLDADEALMIQEMHQSLNRLESRIDALETILIERETLKDK